MNRPNEQTFEFGQARLKAKDSLRFTMRESGNGVWYLVEDEITGRFFQIGLAQYTFLSLLNGNRSVNQAMMKTATLLRQHAINEHEAANLCKWAIESGLVETELSNSASRRAEKSDSEATRKAMEWLNPITFKIPLANPDRLVSIAERYTGWLFSWGGLILWLIVVMFGFFQLASHWQPFLTNRTASFSSSDFLWLVATWFALKLVHESCHTLVCKRFQGRIHSCGILLLLLIPLPYVDVTSSWRFENKWQRIFTAAAGMMGELLIAAIACCVWVWSDPGPLQYHAGNVIIATTLHTLLFNANPLMRFDGYYMLSDLLEIPNLYTHGRQYVKGLFKRIYFGNGPAGLKEVGCRALFVKIYGVLNVAWFFVIAFGLLLGAYSMLDGIGLLVALVGGLLWIGLPVLAFVKYLTVGSELEKPNRARFAFAALLTCGLLSGFLVLCPSPSVVSAPLVIDYEPLSTVRARAAGFAKVIHVVNGQSVEPGQLLVTLDNPELIEELESLNIDLKISRLRADALLSKGDVPALKLENESLAGMEKRREELVKLVACLEIRATQSGVVLARDLSSAEQTYFRPGDEILSIGNERDIQAIALARQEDVDWIEAGDDSAVEIWIWGRIDTVAIHGTISRINPRARNDLPHESFSASVGGPLAVVSRGQVESLKDGEQDSLMLTDPRVSLRIALPADQRCQLMAGQTGVMMIRSRDLNLRRLPGNEFGKNHSSQHVAQSWALTRPLTRFCHNNQRQDLQCPLSAAGRSR